LAVVVDASLIVDALTLGEPRFMTRVERERDLCAPHIIDLEVLDALRHMALQRSAPVVRLEEALADFEALAIERYPHQVLLGRVWDLRDNLSSYDAAYVALAELLNVPLLTRDARLARSSGHAARIEYID
jgi:predicted nucleic acid-binding protein